MNGLDVVIIIVFAGAIIYGAWKGFISQICGVLAFVFGLTLAYRVYQPVSWFFNVLGIQKDWSNVIAFSLILVAVAVAIIFIGVVVKRLLKELKLLWLDRIGGGLFGFLIALLLIGAFVVGLTVLLPEGSRCVRNSVLSRPILGLMQVTTVLMPPGFHEQYEAKREAIGKTAKKAEELLKKGTEALGKMEEYQKEYDNASKELEKGKGRRLPKGTAELELLYPVRDAIVRFTDIKFIWVAPSSSCSYKFYLYEDEEMKKRPFETETTDSQIELSSFTSRVNLKDDATYYWRVEGVENGRKWTSEVRSFIYMPRKSSPLEE